MADQTPIVAGIADTEVGKLADSTTLDLSMRAAHDALSDAGMEWGHVDGLLTTEPLVGAFPRHSAALAEFLGISSQLAHTSTVHMSGASSLLALIRAFELVGNGVCRAVLHVAADTPRTGQDRDRSVNAFAAMRHPSWEQPYGLMNVGAYALTAQAYLGRYGLPQDALAVMPVQMRRNAESNPAAIYRTPIEVADVHASRMVSSPLRLLECSPVSDGGGAFVVTRPSETTTESRVTLTGSGEATTYDSVSYAGDLSSSGVHASFQRASQTSGRTFEDADVALLYDSYSIALARELEEIGFCPPGAATAFVAEGGIDMGSDTPVNPHGGLLSHSHCGGAAGVHHVTEAVRQLTGRSAHQVPNARTALLHAEGGILSIHATAFLEEIR